MFRWIILILYVHDMLITTQDKSKVARPKAQLGLEFIMKDLGSIKRILDMKIHKNLVRERL